VRCSELAEQLGEPMTATAGAATAWLALEEPGPWGARAPGDSRLDPALTAELERRAGAAGITLLLIRAEGAAQRPGRRCLLTGGADPAERFLELVELEESHEVLELDFEAVGRGEPTGAGRLCTERHYLTCTNGKRDLCCAARGRPVARALADHLGPRAWQCTHLGSHRFAANLLVLPDGLLFGRLDPASALRVVDDLERDELALEHLRGRCGVSPAAQAAEALLRVRLSLRGVDEVRVTVGDPPVLEHAGRRYATTVVAHKLPARPVSCAGDKLDGPTEWRLVEIDSTEELQHA